MFDIATTWKAIVLIDEADVFLEERTLAHLERNAMVAVFLRQLECVLPLPSSLLVCAFADRLPLPHARASYRYFRGILFLTTNRVRVFDEAFLFSSSVRDNIALGAPGGAATDEQVAEAARLARAAEFIERLPDGYDTLVGERGLTLSGGQRQRLSIARALIADPAVHLFDDSFSALDVTTDAALRAALRPVTRHVTQIVVAQRVATVLDADQILVLDNGRITARGTHAELLESSPTYREIVDSQLSPEDPSTDTEAEAAR